MNFIKMQGAGNDYIFVDGLIDPDKIRRLSDRHYGIGGDGVVCLCTSFIADVRMRMFNADGSEGKTCGNALRCIGRLLNLRYGRNEFTVETESGVRGIYVCKTAVTVDMGKYTVIDKEVFVNGKTLSCYIVDVGNPHCVIFGRYDKNIALALQDNNRFDGGINVEFVNLPDVVCKVYERGSGITMACGSGACAVAAALMEAGIVGFDEVVTVHMDGGDLDVFYDGSLHLRGSAEKVFEGKI